MPNVSHPIDLGIIIALKEEFRVFYHFLHPKGLPVSDAVSGRTYYLFEWPGKNRRPYHCVAVLTGAMGAVSAALVTERMIQRWHPAIIATVGIAASLDEEAILGDVMVATMVDGYLESSKAIPGTKSVGFDFQASGEIYRASADVVSQIQNYEFRHANSFRQWQLQAMARQKSLIPNSTVEKLQKKGLIRISPMLIEGPIASGPTVAAAASFIEWLKRRNRKFVGLEMETAGVMAAVYDRSSSTPAVVLRGVSDFGDERKKFFDKIGRGAIRAYAVQNIVTFFKALCSADLVNRASRTAVVYTDTAEAQISRGTTKMQVPVWNVPYERNRYFTGRVAVLNKIRHSFVEQRHHNAGVTPAVWLTALGGTGKTQIAVEYAYKYRTSYKGIYFVNAASKLTLTNGFVELATLLGITKQHGVDDAVAVAGAIKFFERQVSWLLIFDNADELELIASFWPNSRSGHILVTSRNSVCEPLFCRSMELHVMQRTEAVRFLLRRTERVVVTGTEKECAGKLAVELGFLPLALEQAGAFIKAKNLPFQDYLPSYKKHRLNLLNRMKPQVGRYPGSVATTWEMNFNHVEKDSLASAELLRFSSFLAPDAIPLEFIAEAGPLLGKELSAHLQDARNDPVSINDIIEPLAKFSLIKLDVSTRTFEVHRLVQEVVKDRMNNHLRIRWVQRAIRALNRVFPQPKFENWHKCEILITHVRSVATLLNDCSCRLDEVSPLLNRAGSFLLERGQYQEAESLLKQSLSTQIGPFSLSTADLLNKLGDLYRQQGHQMLARKMYRKALKHRPILEDGGKELLAQLLGNLGNTFLADGHFKRAETFHRKCLKIRETVLPPDHADIARSLNSLGFIYYAQGKYDLSESAQLRSIAIRRKALGPEHFHVARNLNNLGLLFDALGRHADAEKAHKEALRVREAALGPDHPDVAASLNNLGLLFIEHGRLKKAEGFLKRALRIREERLRPNHPDIATTLNNLALLNTRLGRLNVAETLHARALPMRLAALTDEHPFVAYSYANLGELAAAKGKYVEAERLFRKAAALVAMTLGDSHPALISILIGRGDVHTAAKNYKVAARLYKNALQISTARFTDGHPLIRRARRKLGRVLKIISRACFKNTS